MIEFWQQLKRHLTVETRTSFNSDQSDRPVSLTFTVTNSASPASPGSPEIVFEKVVLGIRTESDGEVVKELGRLGPQDSVVVEHQAGYRDLIHLSHYVVGRVSPETLLTVRSEGTLRLDDVNMPLDGYATVMEETTLHKWLNDTLKALQLPGPDTTLGELRQQSQILSESNREIRTTKERLQKLAALIGRGKTREAVMNHSKQVVSYLDEVDRAIGQVRQNLDSGRPETLKSTLDRLIPRLEQSAVSLDQATERFKQEVGLMSRPAQKNPRQHNAGTQNTAGDQTIDQWDDDESSAGRTPNDDRSDSLNPNNPAYQASMDNRSNQLNPNNPTHHSSRGGGKGR